MNQPVCVVYLSQWFPKPSETFVYHEVEGLYKRGFPVFAAALFGPYPQGGWRAVRRVLTRDMLSDTVPVVRIGARGALRVGWAVLRRLLREPAKTAALARRVLWRRWRNLEQLGENLWGFLCGFYLAELFVRRGVTHMHAAWATGPATAAWTVRLLTGIPFSFWAHAGDVRPQDGALADKLAAAAFARGNASYLIPYLASFRPEQCATPLELVYNSRTLAVGPLAPVAMRPPLQLLAAGRFIETKGFQYLIDALALLRAAGVRAELTLVGSGGWWGKLHERARLRGVEAWVRFPGFVSHDHIPDLLRAADMLVMPSIMHPRTHKSDGLPTVVVEAMFHGVPVIGTAVASMGDVVKDGETGLLIPPNDAAAIASAVQRLADNRDEALRMAGQALKLVRNMFDPDTNQTRLMRLFAAHGQARPLLTRRPAGQESC